MAAPGRAAAEAPGVDLSAQNDFSLWVHTDFNYTTPPFASLTEGLNGSELAGLQNDFQASLQQAYGYKSTSARRAPPTQTHPGRRAHPVALVAPLLARAAGGPSSLQT